jgi:single-strand DNA-binding protein
MANVNKVMLIGRLTREPEMRTFQNGGKVANFGFAVNNRRKNQQSGQWEDYPMFIDCKAFNRGESGKTADLVEQYLHKGHQAYLEGRLDLETWDDKTTGAKRSKHVLLVDNVQFLEPRQQDGGEGGGYSRPANRPAAKPPAAYVGEDDYGGGSHEPPGGGGGDTEIPF